MNNVGIIWGHCWDHVGIFLGYLWDRLGIILGYNLDTFGIIWVLIWDHVGGVFEKCTEGGLQHGNVRYQVLTSRIGSTCTTVHFCEGGPPPRPADDSLSGHHARDGAPHSRGAGAGVLGKIALRAIFQ